MLNKITPTDISTTYVQSAADKLTGSAQQNKAVFDKFPIRIKDRFNELIDALSSVGEESGATEIGVKVIAGIQAANVQGVLEELAEGQSGQIADINSLLETVEYDSETGTFTFTNHAGEVFSFDTALEKVVTNFDYNAETKKLILTTPEQTYEIDLADLIEENDFADSSSIVWNVSGHTVSASIKSEYLTTIEQARDTAVSAALSSGTAKDTAVSAKDTAVSASSSASNSAASASGSANASSQNALKSEGYALGTQNGVAVSSTSPYYHNNAKYYSEITDTTNKLDKVSSGGSKRFYAITESGEQTVVTYGQITIVLSSGGWSGDTQTVSVPFSNADGQLGFPTRLDGERYADAGIDFTEGNGTITFTCETAPTEDITVVIDYRG